MGREMRGVGGLGGVEAVGGADMSLVDALARSGGERSWLTCMMLC